MRVCQASISGGYIQGLCTTLKPPIIFILYIQRTSRDGYCSSGTDTSVLGQIGYFGPGTDTSNLGPWTPEIGIDISVLEQFLGLGTINALVLG